MRNSEEGMAEIAAIDAVFPRLRLHRQFVAPVGARLVDGTIMIKVEVCKRPWSVHTPQVDTECVWAASTVQRANTLERLLHKSTNVSILVMCVCMLDECVPVTTSEAGAHVLCQP